MSEFPNELLGEIADVDWGNTSITKQSYQAKGYPAYSAAGKDGFLADWEHDGDGVVISAIGSVGKISFAEGKWTAIKNTIVAFGKNGICDTRFLYHLLSAKDDWNISGSTQKFLSLANVRNEEVSIPTLPEQKKIAEILSGIDKEIRLRDQKISKLQVLITSLRDDFLCQLLGKESTKVVPLSELSRVVDSLHATPTFVETGVPMVRVTDVKSGVLSLDGTKRVTPESYKTYTRNHEPQEGDIVISRVGSYGITSLNLRSEKFCLGQNTALIHPTHAQSRFLYECLNSSFIKEQIEVSVEGSGYKSLSLASIRSLNIPVPQTNHQLKFASALESLQESIANEVASRKKLTLAKSALSADLLSGRKRVSV
jgi:type I restriction enzyme S subunit